MAKNSVTDYDTTAANNTDVGGIEIEGNKVVANFDNALREIMAHAKAEQTSKQAAIDALDTTIDAIDATAVGLGNVDNTSDANKPVSTAQQTALDAKLGLSGGTMTGVYKNSAQPSFLAVSNGASDSGVAGVFKPGSIQHNTGSCYDSSTGRYTASESGVHVFGGTILSTSAGTLQGAIRKNGANVKVHQNTRGGTNRVELSFMIIIELSTNDYLDFNLSTAFFNSSAHDHLYGHFLG
jgi:hypothetical protein